MNINPITALSEQLQKLITEHGSAIILRDHLALFKDKLIMSEKEFSALTIENVKLKDKIETLESQLQNVTEEIERQKKITEALQGSQSTEKYDPITNKVIKLFFDAGRELSIDGIASKLVIDISTTQYHLDLLSDKTFIQYSSRIPISLKAHSRISRTFEITPQGRKYVIEQMNK